LSPNDVRGTAAQPDADLRAHPPRSGREELGGLVFLARTIDKTRAKLQGTLGEYKVTPGISGYLFEWLGITEDAFTSAVAASKSDDDVVAWLRANTDPSTYSEINRRLLERGIRDEAHRAEILPRYPSLADRPNLRNWMDIFDYDDAWMFNRPQPKTAP